MYTLLDENLTPIGQMSLKSGDKGTKFWGDTITQQIADDGSNDDPSTNLAMTSNKLDKQANHKLWNHTLTISFDNDDKGGQIIAGHYMAYYDNIMHHYYLMYLTKVDQDTEHQYRTATGINSAIYDMAGIYPEQKTFTQATLTDIIKYIFGYVPWSVEIVPNDTKQDYTVDGTQTAQALIQDLQVKFDVEVDAHVDLNNSGQINNRVVWIGKLGTNKGTLIRSDSRSNGYESMTATSVSDSFYTKIYVAGVTDDSDTTAGSITSVNGGLSYIIDDNANRKFNPVGASEGTYRELRLENTVLKNPTALLDWANDQMGLLNHPRYNYTVVALHDMVAGLGDTVAIQDKKAIPEIELTSRVIQRQFSFSSPETNQLTFGEFSSINALNNTSANAISVIKKDVTIVQQAADNAANQAKIAHDEAVEAQQAAIHAQTTADGKRTTFTFNSVSDLPATANQGDQAWVTLSDGTHGYTYLKGKWVEDINPTLAKDITDGVTSAVNTAKANSDASIKANNDLINQTINTVSKQQANNEIDKRNFEAKAQAMADKALSDAKYNTTQVAQDALNSANDSIAQAKYAITDAYKNADGVISKKVDDTATSIGNTISQNKIDSDGKISTAQSTATQALNEVTTKVSRTVYDQKTGDLTQAVSKAQSTADGAVSTVGNYQTSNDGRVQAAESKIEQNSKDITARVTKTDYDQKTGKLSGDISTLKQRADGFDATVTKVDNLSVGGRNLLLNSKILSWGVGNNVATTSTKVSYDSVTNMWHITSPKGGSTNAGIYFSQTDNVSNVITSGQQWAFSFDIKGTGVYSQFGIEWSSTFNKLSGNVPTDWTRVSSTGTTAGTGAKSVIIYFDSTNVALDVYIKLPKLETGNLPTDYSPAPEDIESALAQVKITADGVSSIVSNPTTGLSTRVQTAEGTLNKVNGTDIPALQNATFWQPYSSLNFNDYTKQGSFFFNTTAAKTNGPTTSNAWTYLIVEQGTSDTSRIKQTAWYDGVAGVKITYVRTLNSGTWSPWYANDNDSVTTISQTNSDVRQEISDRKTGDSNTLQSSKDFTQSQITSATTGINSTITQTANAILANISATNLFMNSEFNQDYGWRQKTGTISYLPNQNVDNQFHGIVRLVTTTDGYQGYWAKNIPVQGGSKYSGSVKVHFNNNGVAAGFTLYDLWFVDKNGTRISTGSGGSVHLTTKMVSSPYWVDLWVDGVTAPINAVYAQVSLLATGATGMMADFTMPTFTATDVHQPYSPNDDISAQLSLFKDNWSIGITDNIGKITSGIVGNASQMSLISKNVTIDSPNTQITGTAWIKSAMIANGAIGTAQIGDAAITNAKIADLDVSKLTGDTITGFNFNVNRSMNIASGGVIKSDVVNMDKTSFTVSTTNGNSKSFVTSYNVQTNFSNVNFSIDSSSSQMASSGTILAVAGNVTSSANFETSYAPNNLYFASTNWTGDNSSNGKGSFLRATERSLTLLSGANTVDKADSYTNISSNSVQTKGSIYSDAGIHSGPLYTLGGGAIYTSTGETVYFLDGRRDGRIDIAVKSVSQSSLVSQKTNIGNVDTDYALNEVIKADVRSYSFIDDDNKQIHVSPMIDDVDNKMYIPKDWLDSEHEGVDTYSVIGYLIQAVKELNKKIEQLEQA